MEKNAFSILLVKLRKENGMTQQEVADNLNVSNRTVSKWENGDGYPEITILPKIAALFMVTCDELLSGERNELNGRNISLARNNDLLKEKMYRNNIILWIISYLLIGSGYLWFITSLFTYFNIYFATAIFVCFIAIAILMFIYNCLRIKTYNNFVNKYVYNNDKPLNWRSLITYIYFFIVTLIFFLFLIWPFYWQGYFIITPKRIDLWDYVNLYIPIIIMFSSIFILICFLVVSIIKIRKRNKKKEKDKNEAF